jgi:hypothetical protein
MTKELLERMKPCADSIYMSHKDYVALYNLAVLQTAIAAQNVAGVEGLDEAIRKSGGRRLGDPDYVFTDMKTVDVLREAAKLYAQSRKAVPDGFVLVPVEPTEDIKLTGNGVLRSPSISSTDIYKAMLSAAPDAGED